ncbi:MAG: multidrug efflux MFS transporter, partial [Chloroflexi bacterium]|nr:multidrug efflux MFS transporter [Chloroflexota bacterium]
MLPPLRFFSALEPWRRTLYILFIAQFVSAVGFSNIVPFLPLYVQYLGSRSGLSVEFLAGMTFSAQAITGMVVAPFWGAL